MLERALSLKDCIDDFVEKRMGEEQRSPHLKRKAHNIEKDRLYTHDWEELRQLTAILQPFKQFCLEVEKADLNGSLFNILPSMDCLLDNLETAKQKYKEESFSSHFCTCINLAWEKLDKYYSLTELSPFHLFILLGLCSIHSSYGTTLTVYGIWNQNGSELQSNNFEIYGYLNINLLLIWMIWFKWQKQVQIMALRYLGHEQSDISQHKAEIMTNLTPISQLLLILTLKMWGCGG